MYLREVVYTQRSRPRFYRHLERDMRHGFGILNWNQLRDSYGPVTRDERSSALVLYSLRGREGFLLGSSRMDGAVFASQRSKRRESNVFAFII